MVEELKLVTVYVPGNEAEHLAIGTLLRNVGIKYYSKNAVVQNLFGAGQIGGSNLITGSIEIQVNTTDEKQAIDVIYSDFTTGNFEELSETGDDDYPRAQAEITRTANRSIVFSILWIAGLGSLLAVYFGLKALKQIRAESNDEIRGREKAIAGIILGMIGVLMFTPLWIKTIFF